MSNDCCTEGPPEVYEDSADRLRATARVIRTEPTKWDQRHWVMANELSRRLLIENGYREDEVEAMGTGGSRTTSPCGPGTSSAAATSAAPAPAKRGGWSRSCPRSPRA